ncbi:D-Ala-D-Ala carboxypeptidase family metallohydrolase [bacterium]|nr:D-Ala-D-Ala carboxypeptidase family metallohydrolase [bacterium]
MISKHISDKESVYSRTAIRLDIDNTPTEEHKKNMVKLAEEIFEPLRTYVGGPIKINSFYRSPKLNKAIGGSGKSQHCHGQAIDIDDTFGRMSNAEMYEFIKEHLDYDQMIWEFGDNNNPNWVHVSYVSPQENRNRCLKAYKENGKTNYKII